LRNKRAKIAAYTVGGNVIARLFRNNPKGIGAQYGLALTQTLSGSQKSALAKTDALLKAQPNNPYFHELRGDILVKLNKPADAAKAYQRAMKLDPERSSLIQVGYGQSLLLSGDADGAKSALKAALSRDKDNFLGYQFLAQAYGQLGDIANAELSTAEMYFYGGNLQEAKIFAARAQRKFKTGEPGWLRADDIITQKKPSKKKKT
jgi:predicted Zn-dependent protease